VAARPSSVACRRPDRGRLPRGDEATGATIVLKALAAPLEAIANNAASRLGLRQGVEGKKATSASTPHRELEDLVKPASSTRPSDPFRTAERGLHRRSAPHHEALVRQAEKADAVLPQPRPQHGWRMGGMGGMGGMM